MVLFMVSILICSCMWLYVIICSYVCCKGLGVHNLRKVVNSLKGVI